MRAVRRIAFLAAVTLGCWHAAQARELLPAEPATSPPSSSAEVEPPPAPLAPAPAAPKVPASAPSAEPTSELDLFSLESQVANLAVSVASKREENVEDVPGSVTVITKDEIRDMNARTLRDVLNVLVPGMDVVPTYFRYGDRVNEGIYSRGLLSDFSQQVLILFNGQSKWNETTFSSPFVAIQFNLENIERIEVSRSPTPIQGGSALTVINLVTKEQYLRNTGEGHVALSTNDHDFTSRVVQGVRATGIFGFDLGPLRASASVQYWRDGGQPHRDPAGRGAYTQDPEQLRDGVKNAANFTLSLASLDGRYTFQSWFQYTDSDAFLSGQVPSPNIDLYKYEGLEWLTLLRLRPWRTLQIMAGSMLARWANVVDEAGVPTGGDESNYQVYVEASYELRFQAAGQHSLLTGVRYEREGQFSATALTWNGQSWDTSDDPAKLFAPNAQRDVFSAYADEAWRLFGNRLHLTGGIRFDIYDGFGEHVELAPSGRFALLANPHSRVGLRLLYSTAIRPPSIYERLGETLVPLRGSPDITSERVHTVELSVIGRARGLRVQVTPFFQYFDDKIEYIPDGTAFTAHNNGATRVLGFDLDARYTFRPGAYLFANGSYIHSYDLKNDNQTYFLPSVYVNAGGNYRWRGLNLNTTFYFRDHRPLPANLVQNSAHATITAMWNASVAYTLWGGFRPFFLVENITDQLNNIPLSTDGLWVPMRGRTYHLGLSYTPGS